MLLGLIAGCAKRAIPEDGTYPAQLYVERCGQCHAPYNPHLMTAAMWHMQVDMMQDKMRAAGIPPLNARDRDAILQYLERNAGTE